MKTMFVALSGLMFLGIGTAHASDESTYRAAETSKYRIQGIQVTSPAPGLIRTQLTVQIGDNALNRIHVTRLNKPLGILRDPVMLAGPFGFGMELYEITDGTYGQSLVGTLANAGYDVWVTDDRTTGNLQLGTCDTGAVDCSVMKTWDLEAKVEDETFTRSLVRLFHPFQNPAITGQVGGAIAAIATVNAHPNDYAGLFSYQGAIVSNDPAVQAYDAPFCGLLASLLAADVFFDDSSAPLIALSQAAQSDPNGSAPANLGLPPGLSNLQALLLVLTIHSPSPNFPMPDWITVNGNFEAGTLTYTSLQALFGFNPLYTTFLPVATFKDALCQLAGTETTYSGNLGAFRGDVLFFGSDLAFGPAGADNVALFTHAHTRRAIEVTGSRGELDLIFNRDRAAVSYPVLLEFLSRTFGH
jgi:hypothetical protein